MHWHETKLYLDGTEDQTDRASNPTETDISRLYTEWQKKELRDNGKGMFDKLLDEIAACDLQGLYEKIEFSKS